jgi:hypothetical protein
MISGVTRALIGGCIFIYSCSARLISFEMNLKINKFKRNSSGRTQIYEYTPPPPPINALVTPLGMMHFGCSLHVLVHTAMHLQLSIISTSPNASVIMVQVILLVIKSYGLLQQKMMGKCCLSIFDFISKNVVVFQKGFFVRTCVT